VRLRHRWDDIEVGQIEIGEALDLLTLLIGGLAVEDLAQRGGRGQRRQRRHAQGHSTEPGDRCHGVRSFPDELKIVRAWSARRTVATLKEAHRPLIDLASSLCLLAEKHHLTACEGAVSGWPQTQNSNPATMRHAGPWPN